MKLSLSTPIASLLAAAGEPGRPVTKGRLARLLVPPVAVTSIRDGETVQLATIVRAAEALGLVVTMTVEKKGAVSE